MDGMGSSLTTIFLILIIVGGLTFFILNSTASNLDDTIQVNLQQQTTAFTEECANTGRLTSQNVQKLMNSVSNSIRYDLEIEIWRLDENPNKKTTQTNSRVIGENTYVIYYYTPEDIAERGEIKLEEGWIVVAKIRNVGPTNEQRYSMQSNADLSTMTAESTVTVRVNGN